MSGPGLIQRIKTVQAEKQPEICGSKRKQAIKQNDLRLSFDFFLLDYIGSVCKQVEPVAIVEMLWSCATIF